MESGCACSVIILVHRETAMGRGRGRGRGRGSASGKQTTNNKQQRRQEKRLTCDYLMFHFTTETETALPAPHLISSHHIYMNMNMSSEQ